jgi:transposase
VAAEAGFGVRGPRPVEPAPLVLYDVSVLYFEIDAADGSRGFSKERRLEPQITIRLLTDGAGFPLMVNAFDGNTAETTTMLPMIRSLIRGGGKRPPTEPA